MTGPAGTRTPTRLDIQGLRALAVTLVVLDHAGVPFLRGGYVGVDVFLVVSGYLITGLLLRDADSSGHVRLLDFYARRARRILPVATVVLVAVTIWAGLFLSVGRARQVAADVLWSACFAANVHFARLGTDYFSQDRALSPVQHFWSLAVEEQFYLVWPVLLALVVATVAGARRRRTALAAASSLCAASLVWSVLDTATSPTTAYFSSLTRAWELGAGVLLRLLTSGSTPRLRSAPPRPLVAAAGALAIVLAAVGYDGRTAFPGWAALLPVLGTVALIWAGVGTGEAVGSPGWDVRRVLTSAPATWLGDRSYSVYLWHWPVLVLAAETAGHRRSPLGTVLLLVLTLVLTEVGYRLVEQPFRRGRVRLAQGRTALWLWPATLAAVVLTIVGVARHGQEVLDERVAAAERYYAQLRATGGPLSRTPHTVAGKVRQAVALADAGAPLHLPLVNLAGLSDDLWKNDYPCFATFRMSQARICPVGDTSAARTVVAFGDSHMGMWLPALDELGHRQHFRVVPLVKWGCTGYDVPVHQVFHRAPFVKCEQFRAWAADQIRALAPSTVILANRGFAPNVSASSAALPDVWRRGVLATLQQLSGTVPQVLVLGDVLRVDTDPENCLTEPDATMASCTFEGSERSAASNRMTAEAAEQAGVRFVGVETLTCTVDGRCPLAVGHTVVYRDDDHITMTWARQAAGDLGRRLALGPPP